MSEYVGNLVTVDNTLVMTGYGLGVVEKRLIVALISLIDNGQGEGYEVKVSPADRFTISVQDYAEVFGIEYKTAKEELYEAVDKLWEQDIKRNVGNKIEKFRWFSYIAYVKDSHQIEIEWSKQVIPYISELRANFTSYRLRNIAKLKSVYAIRWYEILTMELNASKKSNLKLFFAVEDVKKIFALGDTYSSVSDIRRFIFELPLVELSKNTDLQAGIKDANGDYLYRKEGKKIIEIGILVNRKKRISNAREYRT